MANLTRIVRIFTANQKVTVLKELIAALRDISQRLDREQTLPNLLLKSVMSDLQGAKELGIPIDFDDVSDLQDLKSVFTLQMTLVKRLREAQRNGDKMKMYHGTTEKFHQLHTGEDLTDEESVAETYAKERARQRNKDVIYVYEFDVDLGVDVGSKRYNPDQGHDQWQSKNLLTPVSVKTKRV
jgi:hypothetical protein